MTTNRYYPLVLVATLAICAAIATAFVGAGHETRNAPQPVEAAISTSAQP